jgi:glycosyltransferase involved in cell wall biosynthesis
VVVQRFLPSAKALAILQELRETRNLRLAYEIDDHLWEDRSEAGVPAGGKTESVDIDQLLKYTELCSVVTTSTELLKEGLIAIGIPAEKIRVLPNRIDRALWRTTPELRIKAKLKSAPPIDQKPENEMWFLYMGTWTHRADLEMITPVFAELHSDKSLGRTPRLVLIGGAKPEELGSEGTLGLEIPNGRYPNFVRWLCSISSLFDAAIAPLVPSRLNLCKSNLKYLSYGALGLCGFYSDVDPYRAVVRNGRNGFLVKPDIDDWRRMIVYACRKPDEIRKIGQRAKRHAVRYFSYSESAISALRATLAMALER